MINPEKKQQSFELDKALEKEWWHLLRSGDKLVLSKIYNAYLEGMFGYGMTIIADRDLIKDCIQDVFIDLWKYRANLSNTDNIKFYLLKSLRNKIYNITAREKKVKARNLETDFVTLTPCHEETMIADQRNLVIQKKLALGIEKLPERQREVLRHLYFENHSYEDTSSLMAINIRSVYTLAWKALSSLRKSMPTLYFFVLLIIDLL